MANENAQRRKQAAINIECDPSLTDGLVDDLRAAGFKHKADLIITLVRDFRAGRIKYNAGILQPQAKIA